MIDIKELRIGSVVYINNIDGVFIINSIEKNSSFTGGYVCIMQFGEKSSPNNLSPIPLTKELLLKCGFSELDDVYENDNIEVTNIDGKFRLTYNVYEYLIAEKPIEYLHQLQNLFLDLTDRVLDVKL